jgi:tagatose 1,6-diphosphate aldolase
MRKSLTIGKLRGLQQLSNAQGIFAMCAMDHRGSMQRIIDRTAPDQVTYDMLVEYKRDLTELLAPESTAVLLDPIYGAAQAVADGMLPGRVALLVSLEETGYESDAQGRVPTLLPEWSVEKIKRMGASAVKILLYYRPDLAENASRQRQVTRRVAEDCARFDIPFLIEPITYPISQADRFPETFAALKPVLVFGSARELTPLGVDVLKVEFPADMHYEQDEGKLLVACQAINEASQAPWILLSAGVTFEEFSSQVKISCQAGASGFLGGRAIWEEAMQIPDRSERRRWLATVGRTACAACMKSLANMVSRGGRNGANRWLTW